jgi:hypothetical protein
MWPWLAGLAKKRQVIAAYNQLIGAKRQTFRGKSGKNGKKIPFKRKCLAASRFRGESRE